MFYRASITTMSSQSNTCSCRRGDTYPKYMEPMDRRLRGWLRQSPWSQAHDRVSGTHSVAAQLLHDQGLRVFPEDQIDEADHYLRSLDE